MATYRIHNIKSQYKHVEIVKSGERIYYRVSMPGVGKSGFSTEREAALAADKLLIKKGKEPVNILKRKEYVPN
jgi:hypothetical protein